MSRFRRLLRALATLLLAAARTVLNPAWTRDFLAYVYTYRPLPYSPRIVPVKLSEVVPGASELPVSLRKCFPQHGNMTGEEIVSVCLLVRWVQPSGVFEFGTFNGNTTLQMALNAPSDCRIFTLNLPPDHGETKLVSSAQDRMVHPRVAGSGQVFRNEPESARISELFGDSATFDYSPYRGQCDFVLVDAGHEYDYVKSDTQNALSLLRSSGGLIVWHDFPNAPGVCTWLEEFGKEVPVYHIAETRLAFAAVGALSEKLIKSRSGAADQ
jgi:hypothetical protein